MAAWNRGWQLLRSWQLPDGGWRPAAGVANSAWGTALSITVHSVHGVYDQQFERGLAWMLGTKGTEGGWMERAVNAIHTLPNEYDRRYKGWPWSPESSSWVEPTAHSLLALKKVSGKVTRPELQPRIVEGERMILDRRSTDGGWNYGNRRVLRANLPSYAETTGIALLGLQGTRLADLRPAIDIAQRYWEETRSGLAKAWLGIILRNYGRDLPLPGESAAPDDLMLTALECIACPNGGHQWLKPV